ncbi:COMM domain-containing protein 8-like [Bacillus rossius redtenbacheri]|uniref:COMM domain-containing protein 8-like n=1 Tax=Bacillus rossius redtenbacheri TaxID=93214 RepID=UPI002FDC8CEB
METDLLLWSNVSNDQVFQEFLHACIDEVCGRRGPSYDTFRTSCSWTEDEFSSAARGVRALVRGTGRDDGEVLQLLPDLPASRQKVVLECLEVRRSDISQALRQEQCRISGPALEDFDWKLKWVMGSSSLSALREPLLEVDLHLSEGRGEPGRTKPSVLSLELDCAELNVLVTALEKARDSLKT